MNAEKIFGENVYVNLDEVIETVYQCRREEANDEWVKRWLEPLKNLATIEASEEDELKFYYVESIDDYWIGQRLDNFYYAKWNSKLGFVWSASRYLPWGEHIVDENTLWKEHTYPSEPREIPFTEWVVGFMKKYGSEVSEDCISRLQVLELLNAMIAVDSTNAKVYAKVFSQIKDAPSVLPKRSCYRCGLREDCEDSTERKPKEGEWQITDAYPHNVYCSECHKRFAQTHWAVWEDGSLPRNYCPNCGAKMKG